MDLKTLLGLLGVGCSLTAYVLYLRDMFRRHTKPHAFSWLVWSMLAGIAFAAQVRGGAGAGAWVTFSDAALCLVIFGLALWRGEKGYVPLDWIALLLAGAAILLWQVTASPVGAVLLVTAGDVLGFLPTYRKSLLRPHEESASMYMLSTVKYTTALLAIDLYSFTTAFYVAVLILTNAGMVTLLLVRRRMSPPARAG